MSYVSKKEKVFDLPDLDENNLSLIKSSDFKPKIFPSVCDVRPTALEDDQKYQQICAAVNKKKFGEMKSTGFKYIPFDVLLTILMAEKDAYIQKLLMKEKNCTCGEQFFKADQFQDAEDDKEALIRKDAEVVALKNRNAGLETELEECKDTLKKAIFKLENVEEIMNEKEFYKEKLKYMEETVKILEESKDIEKREKRAVDKDTLSSLLSERDGLRQQIKNLQEQIIESEINTKEIELLKEQTETFASRLETLLEENELYKKKLEGMKYLEKCFDDLRRQACVLSEKYKRESCRANEQMNQLNAKAKELQEAYAERDLLRIKLKELASVEFEYNSIKKKLSEVEELVDENRILHKKLSLLHELKLENEKLEYEIRNLKSAEKEVNVTKEMVEQLKCDLSDKEKEIKSLLSKIEYFSKNYIDKNELDNLKNQLKKKDDILKEYECRLNDIPTPKFNSETIRGKLQKYMDDYKSDEKLIKPLQDELEAYIQKCPDFEEVNVKNPATLVATRYEDKVRITEELVTIQEFINESCCIIKMDSLDSKPEEKVDETKDLTSQNANSGRIGAENSNVPVGMNLVNPDLNQMLIRTNKLKAVLDLKEERIRNLESEMTELRNSLSNCTQCQILKKHSSQLESEISSLREVNQQLQSQLVVQYDAAVRIENLEKSLKNHKKSCEFFRRLLKDVEGKLASEIINHQNATILSKLIREEAFLSKKTLYKDYLTEIEDLKNQIFFHKTLVEELKEENYILNELKMFVEFTGKKNLTNVITKLKSELVILQDLHKPHLEAECETLQAEVKRLVIELDHLMKEMEDLKAKLDMERKSKEYLENELCQIQKEFLCRTKIRTENCDAQTQDTADMAAENTDQTEEIRNALNDIKLLKDENDEFVKEIAILQNQCRDFQDEVTVLHNNMDELNRNYSMKKNTISKQKEEINALNEKIKAYEQDMTNLKTINDEFSQKTIELREKLTAKEAEVERTKKELSDMKNEIVKLDTEVGRLKRNVASQTERNDATNSKMEKNNSETTIPKVENELEELRRKLESCGESEEKLSVLRTWKDNLIVKVNCFESEVQFLKKKLSECNFLKNELEKLKTETKPMNVEMAVEGEEKLLTDIFGLREHLQRQQREIEHARCENSNLKDKLHELGNLLEICKKMHKTMPQNAPKTDIGIVTSNLNGCEMVANDKKKSYADCSTSCEKIGDSLSTQEFEIKLTKVEDKHKMKVLKLKEGNALKIKQLIDQYKKEIENNNRIYNDNLNNIKSNYEYDIRKLVEKHKSSILRLQYLHEDEIKELNTNYETQMEAMQTLHENAMSDLSSGAVEKSELTEKYNKYVKEIESKFQKLLKEKDNRHTTELANLQESLTRNMNELKELHKQAIDNLNHVYGENLVQLEEKHRKELKEYKKSNIKINYLMRRKYEDLLIEERKKYEEQMQIMSNRLKLGEKDDEINGNLKLSCLKRSLLNNNVGSQFNIILEKILNEGLESVKFEELMLVHCKTCFAAGIFYEKSDGKTDNEMTIKREGCPHLPLLKEDREELMKRIFLLENEIAMRQLETRKAINNMETIEKCRLEEINNLLRKEREKNGELEQLLTAQSKVQTDLKIESYMSEKNASLRESDFMEVVKELEVEKSRKLRLEEEVQKEKNNNKRLTSMLENERQRYKAQRKKDSDYIQAMRIRLEEALNHEHVMESRLDYEAQIRTKLEFEFESLQRTFNLIIDQSSSAFPSESKVVKDIRNLDQIESEKGEKLTVVKSRSKIKSQKSI